MSTQPTAIFLAEVMENDPASKMHHDQSAAELRRLHELALEHQGKIYALEMARSMEQKTAKLKQDALLEALRATLEVWEEDPAYGHASAEKARAAIAKAEGKL
jgi:hypothetical protein